MYSACGYFAMILLITITGVQGRQNARKSRNGQPLSWYPLRKDPQMKSGDSYYSPTRITLKEEFPSKRSPQFRHRYLRTLSDENGENSDLSLFRQDSKRQDDDDPHPNLVKKDSRYKIAKNPDDDDPDLSFFKKDSRYQTMKNPDEEDPDVSFPKKDSRRQAISNPDYESEDYVKESSRRNSPSAENLYDSDYDTAEKEDAKIPYETTPDSNYEDVDDDDVVIAPQRESKAKRDQMTPKVAQEISQALNKEISSIISSNETNPCKNCGAIRLENEELKARIENDSKRDLLPAYACDRWFANNRTCWLDRNIGNTVTFVLAFGEGPKNAQVQWRQEFHLLDSNKRRIFNIDSDKPMWNIVIGSRGHEFRISPVTETDIDSNSFSAIIVSSDTKKMSTLIHHKVNFRIKLIPIDQAFVYPGETLMLNMRRVTLPQQSLRFKWFMEKDGEKSTLPSNMKLSPGADMLVISELRQEQKGIIACSVFTNLGFFATKQRYLLNVSTTMHNILLFESTTTTTAEPGLRKKRSLEAEDNIEQALINLDSRRKQQSQQQGFDASNGPNRNRGESTRFRYSPEQEDSRRTQFRTNDPVNNNPPQYSNPRTSRQVQFGPQRNQNPQRGRGRQVGAMEDDDIPESNRNSNKIESIVMEVDRRPEMAEARAEDNLSKLIASCTSDLQCAPDAVCVQGSGFCRCTLGFQGNGMFCWADAQMRSSGSRSDAAEGLEGAPNQMEPQGNRGSNDY